MKILITDPFSEEALRSLRSHDLTVDVKPGLTADELEAIIGEYHGLVAGSATRVTKEVIQKGDNLRVIGIDGTVIDNVDSGAATEKGVVVMNTPEANALAVAEHTMALMFAVARKIVFADRSMKEGKWLKSSIMGIELHGKTLGIIGLGHVGSLVAERGVGLGMRILAHDLFVSREVAGKRGVMCVGLDTLFTESDFITLHIPLVEETRNLINKDAMGKMKRGVIIINTARGPLMNEGDLCDALESGLVGGAGLDVFDTGSPTPENRLLLSQKTVCTPGIGAFTREAREKAAHDMAGQMVDLLVRGVIRNSINTPALSFDVSLQIGPYIQLSERLATLVSGIMEYPIDEVEIEYAGEVSEMETTILARAVLKSILSPYVGGVNYVNALALAKARGMRITEARTREQHGFASLITIRLKGGAHVNIVQGTLLGNDEPRLVKVNNIYLEADLTGCKIFLYNHDRPGVVGDIGNLLAGKGISIGGMRLGRESFGGLAISIIELDQEIGEDVIREIQSLPNIVRAKRIRLS